MMPTVKTNKMFLYGKDFTRRITVRSDGMFYCKLPEKVVTVLGLFAVVWKDERCNPIYR